MTNQPTFLSAYWQAGPSPTALHICGGAGGARAEEVSDLPSSHQSLLYLAVSPSFYLLLLWGFVVVLFSKRDLTPKPTLILNLQ